MKTLLFVALAIIAIAATWYLSRQMRVVIAVAVIMLLSGLFWHFFGKTNDRDIGAVSTDFRIIGPNNKISVSAFDDPKVEGITCYVARPKTGGIQGALGLAEDPSIVSVSCVQNGPIRYLSAIDSSASGEKVFDENRSIAFKTLDISRIYDEKNASLIYVGRTHRILKGEPTTSLSVIAPMSWGGVKPEAPLLD